LHAPVDLAAITRLDEVRTDDLTLSREHLTNSTFSARDTAHISAMANKMRIAINDQPTNNHPAIEMRIAINDQPTNNHPAIDEVDYNFIFFIWESRLFWGFLEIVVFHLQALSIFYATLAIALPAIATGVFDLSLSWLIFNEFFPTMLLTASFMGLICLGVPLITHELFEHGTDRAVNLVTSPFRWSASFFSTNSVEETPWTEEEEDVFRDFLLSSP
jgi:hypothetical protein